MTAIVTQLDDIEKVALNLLDRIRDLKVVISGSKVFLTPLTSVPKKPAPPVCKPAFAAEAKRAWEALRLRYKRGGLYIRTAGLANGTFYFMKNEAEPDTRRMFGIIRTDQYVIVTTKQFPIWELRKWRPLKHDVDRAMEGAKADSIVVIHGLQFAVIHSYTRD